MLVCAINSIVAAQSTEGQGLGARSKTYQMKGLLVSLLIHLLFLLYILAFYSQSRENIVQQLSHMQFSLLSRFSGVFFSTKLPRLLVITDGIMLAWLVAFTIESWVLWFARPELHVYHCGLWERGLGVQKQGNQNWEHFSSINKGRRVRVFSKKDFSKYTVDSILWVGAVIFFFHITFLGSLHSFYLNQYSIYLF